MINIDEEVQKLPLERSVIAFQRALNKVGIPYELNSDGSIAIGIDELEDLEEYPEFLDAHGRELKQLVLDDTFAELVEKGALVPDGINEDGSIAYVIGPNVENFDE